jgi:hypothetical protein
MKIPQEQFATVFDENQRVMASGYSGQGRRPRPGLQKDKPKFPLEVSPELIDACSECNEVESKGEGIRLTSPHGNTPPLSIRCRAAVLIRYRSGVTKPVRIA